MGLTEWQKRRGVTEKPKPKAAKKTDKASKPKSEEK